MTDTTPRLGLPWLMPAQAQKHVTVNDALGRLDALVCASVESASTAAPPATPGEGEAYILPAAPTGADWESFEEHDLVWFQDGAWRRAAPRRGLLVHVADAAGFMMWTGSGWADLFTLADRLENLSALGVGTAPDAANPFAAKLNSALWTARFAAEGGTGDLRYTLNKETAGDTAAVLFQSGWSGRAELGLAGDDDFSLKVSADGAAWTTALTASADGSGVTVQTLRAGAGAAAAPGLAFSDAPDTGLFHPGSDVAISVTGAERARFTSAGAFGVGTESPTSRLHVRQDHASSTDIEVENGEPGGSAGLTLDVGTYTSRFYAFTTNGNTWLVSDGDLTLRTDAAEPIVFQVDGGEAMRLAADGALGLGTSAPGEKLDVNADAVRLRQARTPASASATGAPGTICWDGDHVYVCVAADTWKRAALSTW
ncbi:MAG: DUF2793 domain-containing protein [Oceanicaulis sp.]